MHSVHVSASREYDVLIGANLIGRAGALMAQRFAPCRVAVLTDDIVDGLYGEAVRASLEAAGFQAVKYAFPNGEGSKNLDTLGEMLEFMARGELSRGDMVLALGGGVPGDMAGFAAAVYARGIRFVQVPTTLLAAVDASVGGKTAVNLKAGKNLAGAFAQPALVVCDTDVLSRLPDRLMAEGAAEIIKCGVLADRTLFDIMRAGGLRERLEDIVTECVTIKRDLVAGDEFDLGRRQLLNLGHTLGHAVERRSGYAIPHGRAVAMGLVLIARAAAKLGRAREDIVPALTEALSANSLPVECPYTADELLGAALLDKKRRGGVITLVVPEEIGRCALVTVPVDELPRWIGAGVGA